MSDINGERRAAGLPEWPGALPPPLLDHNEIAALLAHTALVLKPGETLILRVKDWTWGQMAEYQAALSLAHEQAGWPKVILVAGDEMGIAQTVPPLAERVRAMATSPRPGGRRG